MKKIIKVLISLVALLALTGCASGLGFSPRGNEHKAAIEDVVAQAKDFGLGKGQITKDCAVPFDCSANDQFSYNDQLTDKDFNSDEALCQNLFAFGEKLGFKKWRRDYHEQEETLDQGNFADGVKACSESLAVNGDDGSVGQSEGVIVYGEVDSGGKPVSVQIQVNSVRKPEFAPGSARGYYFLISTIEG
jgi:hypothetical protein